MNLSLNSDTHFICSVVCFATGHKIWGWIFLTIATGMFLFNVAMILLAAWAKGR